MFSKLVRFKEEHGHCNVPFEWSKDPGLGRWVGAQRSNYSCGKLSLDKVERFEALGFEWDGRGRLANPSNAAFGLEPRIRRRSELGHDPTFATLPR
jgi:hypothetical protein